MRRQRSILVIACIVAAAGVFAWMSARGRPCPLAVRFDRLTDSSAVFIITNRSETQLQFRTLTEFKANGNWPTYPVGTVLPHTGPYDIGPHESRELTLLLPADGTSARLSVACEEPWTAWERRRRSVSVWFYDQNLPALGRLISDGKRGHLILSSEVHK